MKNNLPRLLNQLNSPFAGIFDEPLWNQGWVENEGKYVLEVSLPGMEQEDVDLQLEGDIVKIAAEKKVTKGSSFYSSSTSNTFSIPEDLKRETLDASFQGGVLTITADKGEPVKKKKIEFKIK